jgi:Spy/CpxP family protein refolding chaperone
MSNKKNTLKLFIIPVLTLSLFSASLAAYAKDGVSGGSVSGKSNSDSQESARKTVEDQRKQQEEVRDLLQKQRQESESNREAAKEKLENDREALKTKVENQKNEIENRKVEIQKEKETKLDELEKDKCTRISIAVDDRLNNQVNGYKNAVNRYKELQAKITNKIATLKAANKDTTKLETDLVTLQSKIENLNTLALQTHEALKNVKSLSCAADKTAYQAALDAARASRKLVTQAAADIHEFIKTVIAPDLTALQA